VSYAQHEERFLKILTRILPAASIMACLAASASPALAATSSPAGQPTNQGTVYVQTDNTAGNQVVAYHRDADGVLTETGSYATGGLGGVLGGSVVDHLASQGSLEYDGPYRLLLAVNAGSDTVSVFAVRGGHLRLCQVISSDGSFPVSIATHGDLVYVLNALGGGSVSGYRVSGGHLMPLDGSHRALGLNPDATPQFTTTPGQVAFTPDGSQVIVTTKANGNDIDVFGVGAGGWLSAKPVVNSEPGTVPFAVSYDRYGHLVVVEAGTDAIATFAIHGDGTLRQLGSALTGQTATCWVARSGRYFYASNAGSASVTGYRVTASGQPISLGNTATDAGTVDAVAAGGFLYVRAGAKGIVDEYRIRASGALTEIGSVTVAGAAGGEGIAAS
jgi:6-phosphogluconolactonase (cycloisomerase 2 family)